MRADLPDRKQTNTLGIGAVTLGIGTVAICQSGRHGVAPSGSGCRSTHRALLSYGRLANPYGFQGGLSSAVTHFPPTHWGRPMEVRAMCRDLYSGSRAG
jgi:hypothetical protein